MENQIAISDIGTMLYHKGATKFEELLEIISTPDQGSAGGTIEVTVLKSAKKQYIPDRVDSPDQDFGYNYTETNYAKALDVCDGEAHEFLVKFQDGSGYTITGVAQTWVSGMSRGQAVEGTLHVVPSDISDVKPATDIASLIA